jgi:hypothetical protein
MQEKITQPIFSVLIPGGDLLKNHEPMQQFFRFQEHLDALIQTNPPVISKKITLPYKYAEYANRDVMHGFTHNAIVISEKFQKLLADFHLPQHQYFRCDIKMPRGKVVNYFCLWLPVLPQNPSPIDFEKTPFYVSSYDETTETKGVKYFVKDFLEAGAQQLLLSGEQYLTQVAAQYDFFCIWGGSLGIYVSPRLREAISQAGITGVYYLNDQVYGV